MIDFVNAKINIGLQIVGKRENGYHDLQTVFYPVGKYAGTPSNPAVFCDILEITLSKENTEVLYTGRSINCDPEKNLVFKAAKLYMESFPESKRNYRIMLDKHLPDGAGMGGGSADAGFTLRMLDRLNGMDPDEDNRKRCLAGLALKLGADCPFFIYNEPMYGEGLGEILTPLNRFLRGWWCLVVKPAIYVSTKEAFAGIKPRPGSFDLRKLPETPVSEWQNLVKNDFEDSIFPKYPLLAEIKSKIIDKGAVFASMSGSGSSIYGLFRDREMCSLVSNEFRGDTTIEQIYLLEL